MFILDVVSYASNIDTFEVGMFKIIGTLMFSILYVSVCEFAGSWKFTHMFMAVVVAARSLSSCVCCYFCSHPS